MKDGQMVYKTVFRDFSLKKNYKPLISDNVEFEM